MDLDNEELEKTKIKHKNIENIYNCCTLCLNYVTNDKSLIWLPLDCIHVCHKCYNIYKKSNLYNQKMMLIGSIKNYKNKLYKINEFIKEGCNTSYSPILRDIRTVINE